MRLAFVLLTLLSTACKSAPYQENACLLWQEVESPVEGYVCFTRNYPSYAMCFPDKNIVRKHACPN